jgi:hypothetical protein
MAYISAFNNFLSASFDVEINKLQSVVVSKCYGTRGKAKEFNSAAGRGDKALQV